MNRLEGDQTVINPYSETHVSFFSLLNIQFCLRVRLLRIGHCVMCAVLLIVVELHFLLCAVQ